MIEIPKAKPIIKRVDEQQVTPSFTPISKPLQKHIDNKIDTEGFAGLNRMPFGKKDSSL
jgi:hypothetical protein